MSRPREDGWGTERAYDRLSRIYDLIFDPFCVHGRRRAIHRMACRSGDRILEVGVGTGASIPLYPDGIHVTGVDLSWGMLGKARSRWRRGQGRARWGLARMDAGRLGFLDDSFDKVVAFHVISVLPDPVAAIAEMKRVCVPGGELILVNHFHHKNPLLRRLESLLDPLTRRIGWQADLDLDELVRDADLNVVEVEPVNLCGYWSLVHVDNGQEGGTRESAAGLA